MAFVFRYLNYKGIPAYAGMTKAAGLKATKVAFSLKMAGMTKVAGLKATKVAFSLKMTGITKHSFWVLSLLFFLSSQALFPIITFACSKAFQEITPEQFKARLALIAPNKKDIIDNLDIDPSVPYTLTFKSNTGISFKVTKDASLAKPEIELSSSSKTLKIPSYNWLHDSSSNSVIKSWLIGHEIHPYTSPSKNILHTEAQNTAFQAFKQTLSENVNSFLHIAPTSAGKTLVLAKALKEKIQNHRIGKVSFVTAHQIRLVDQLFETVQQELKEIDVTVINWNERLNKDFYVEIERAIRRNEPTVFVITSQSLKQQLNILQHKSTKVYNRLTENTDGIYIDEAHHLGAFHTKEALLTLKEKSKAFLYGSTATPVHHEVNLREFFEREHWSYLNNKENLFDSHAPAKIIDQLSLGIEKGEITPFEYLYIVGESKKFNITKTEPLFIQSESRLRVLNPHYHNNLAGMLHPIFQSNKKGFIVTATIAEAKRLTEFLSEAIEGITFETYHSEMTREQRQEVLRNSEEMSAHYIIAVRALDEGVNLPHLSGYIDLNVNVSVKQMVHRIGRVLRLHPGNTGADVLFLADYRNEEMARDLLSLLDIVNVSKFHRGIRYRDGSGDTKLRGSEVTSLTRQELRELREELEQSARNFWNNKKNENPPISEVIEILRRKNIMWEYEWKKQRETDPELQNIPKTLASYKEWKGWLHFREEIGKGKPSYEELIEILISKDIFSGSKWETQKETDPELKYIPKRLSYAYKEWNQNGGWEYVRTQANKGKPTYETVIEILISKNIFFFSEWKNQRETDPELKHIPKSLNESYKEWNQNGGWGYVRTQAGFTGTSRHAHNRLRYKNKPTYEKLVKILVSKNILSGPKWKQQRETDPELKHIPKNLHHAYEKWNFNGGWEYVRKQAGKGKPSYEKLIEILIEKNIFSGAEWETQKEIDPELQHIPKNLHQAYKEWGPNGGWKYVRKQVEIDRSIYKDKPTYEELVEILVSKNIFSFPEWETQRETDPELQHIPKSLSDSYEKWNPNGKWEYVRKQAGKGKPSYEKLIEILIGKNIFSGAEWETQKETDPELKYIPKRLSYTYEEWNQNGGWEYVRKQAGITSTSKPSYKYAYKDKPTYEELVEILISKNILSGPKWKQQRETDPELKHIPKNLYQAYEKWNLNGGWEYVRKQAGITTEVGRSTYTDRPNYEELVEILVSKNILSGTKWKKQRETDPELQHIPKRLYHAYKEWNQNGGWKYIRYKAGTGGPIRDKPSYEKLIEILISKNIFSGAEWETQKEIDPELQHIPKILSRDYEEWNKNGGWEYVRKQASKGKLSYEKLVEILVSKNIFWHSEWETQRETDPELKHIPKSLHTVYKEWNQNGGWKYIRYKAGTGGSVSDKPLYEKLIEILISKNIFFFSEWKNQRETDPELQHIPKRLSYAYEEWNQNGGWEYVRTQAGITGTSRRPTYEDRPIYKRLVEILVSKNIFWHSEWETQRETDPELQHIPKNLRHAYKEWGPNGGWGYVRTQAGITGTIRPTYEDRPTYEELVEILVSKNILSGTKWNTQRETDPELQHIPKNLYQAYKEWKGWKHFREQMGVTTSE